MQFMNESTSTVGPQFWDACPAPRLLSLASAPPIAVVLAICFTSELDPLPVSSPARCEPG